MRDFVAATWNTAGGTPDPPGVDQLAVVLDQLEHHEVTVLLLQELTNPGVLGLLRSRGWRVHRAAPQYGIAWRPDTWTEVRQPDRVRLARTRFYRVHSSRPVPVDAARALLCDREGRSITVLSYHTPSSVQQPGGAPPNRLQALREAMGTLRQLAAAACSTACLFGGDDNVDERVNRGAWAFMLRKATGLQLVQAPSRTIGRRDRRIDDFRVRRLEAGHGLTLDGAGDHRVHVRVFRWL